MRTKTRLLAVLPVAAALFVATESGLADEAPLIGTSGPGFTITLKNADGSDVKHLDPGARTIVIHDLATNHSFHLRGPGVDMATPIEDLQEASWQVALADGTYKFFCDMHPTSMHGQFTVGVVPPAQPKATVRKLGASVGPKSRISLGSSKILAAGTYLLTVRDRSKTDNFHLTGPGVNRKTGVAFRGRVTWKVVFAAGKVYRYRSDAHRRLGGGVRIT